jgi:predicted dehydrogenase
MGASRRVGYAVVGLGRIAERAILPAFRHSKKARLVALVSGDDHKAQRLARQFGAEDFFSYDDFAFCLSHPKVEAVFIATANQPHAELTERAAAAGKHVLCEKPMATSVEGCLGMIQACRANSVRLMIAYRKYFEPASLALKKLVASGKLGRLKFMHSAFTFCLAARKKGADWHLDRKLSGGGSLVDVGVYSVNTARWLAGLDPAEASAFAWTTDPARFNEVEENIAFRLNFPGGLVLQATAGYGAAQASFLQVCGEKGWAGLNPAYAYDEERRLFGKIQGRWFEKKFRVIDEFALELDAFADCVRRKKEPEPNGVEGMKDVSVMQAVYRSVREGRPVGVSYPPLPAG